MYTRVTFRLDGQTKVTDPVSPRLLSLVLDELEIRGGTLISLEQVPDPEPAPQPRKREWPRYTRADGRPLIYLPSWFPFDFVGR